MRRSLIVLALSLFSLSGFAFQDHAVNTQLDSLRSKLRADGDVKSRLATFDHFRDSLNRYLQGDEESRQGESWGSAPIGISAEAMAEFAELNEFAQAVFSVRIQPANKGSCAKAKVKAIAEASFRADGNDDGALVMASSGQVVAELIDLICR